MNNTIKLKKASKERNKEIKKKLQAEIDTDRE